MDTITLYHWSHKKFSSFNKKFLATGDGWSMYIWDKDDVSKQWFYFSDNKETALSYANKMKKENKTDWYVYEVEVKNSKVFNIQNKIKDFADVIKETIKFYDLKYDDNHTIEDIYLSTWRDYQRKVEWNINPATLRNIICNILKSWYNIIQFKAIYDEDKWNVFVVYDEKLITIKRVEKI